MQRATTRWQVFPATRYQRCWVHKTVNVLDKLPRGPQVSAKSMLHEIWMAATKEDAAKAMEMFAATYQAKYPKAVECLLKDQEELLAFYDFPAEHWQHLRTSNPIESTFATVRLRTSKTKGAGKARYYAIHRGFTAPLRDKTMRRLIPADQLERAVLDIVRDVLLDTPDLKAHLIEQIETQRKQKDSIPTGLAKLEAEREKISQQIELAIDSLGSIGKEAAKAKLQQLEARLSMTLSKSSRRALPNP